MDKKKINKNYIFNVSYQLFAILVPIILTPYISRVLGAEKIGIYSFSYSIVSYFMLFAALGTNTFAVKKLGETHDKNCLSREFLNILVFRTITSIISIISYFIYYFSFSERNIIVLLQGLYIFSVMVDISWFYQGIEKYKSLSFKNFIFKILSVIFIFIFVKEENDLWLYILGLAGFTIAGNLSMWLGLRRIIDWSYIKHINPFENYKKIIAMFFPTIATQLYSIIDKTMIGLLIDSTFIEKEITVINGIEYIDERLVYVSNLENGYYEQAEKIIKMSFMIVFSMGYVKIPQISYSYTNKQYGNVKELLCDSFEFVWFLTIPMCFGLIAISDNFVPLFFGDGFDKISDILKIFSLFFIFMGINNVIGVQYLISTGQQKLYSYLLIVTGIVNILLNFMLIPSLYSIGACIASIVGEFLLSILCIILIIKKRVLTIRDIFSKCYKNFISGIIMFATISILFVFLKDNWVSVLFSIVCGIGVYCGMLLLMKDQYLLTFINKMKEKIKG